MREREAELLHALTEGTTHPPFPSASLLGLAESLHVGRKRLLDGLLGDEVRKV